MVSKYYLLQIVLFVILLALTLAGSMIVWIREMHPAFLIVGGVLLLAEILAFIWRMNVVNRQMTSVINTLGNYDTAFRLPPASRKRMTGELEQAFENMLNSFQKLKFEYAAREQLFLAMIENSSTGFISIDEHGDFEIMNQTARKLLGTRFTSNLSRLKAEMPGLHALLTDLDEGEAGTYTIHGAEGASLVRVAPAKMQFHDQVFTLVSLQDIRREVDARELESWQKLIRILNHEIMNSIAPITSASRYLKSLFKHGDQPVEPVVVDEKKIAHTLDGLEIIESMSDGLQHFVESYRKLSRIPDPVRVSVDPGKWSSTLKVLGGELLEEAGGRMEVHVEEDAGTFEADEGLLNQVMLNLIHNAVEAPDKHGTQQRRVEISIGAREGRQSCIRVKNNGDPIEPEVLDKIFIPFFTTKEKGAGIGLFLSRQIISMHNGTLDAYTATDGDTVFEILL